MSIMSLKEMMENVQRFSWHFNKVNKKKQKGYIQNPLTLTESRTIYEMIQQGLVSTSYINKKLFLEHGYTHRTMKDLTERNFLEEDRCQEKNSSSFFSINPSRIRNF
ncbi:hypothetical protein D3C74_249810 [compost metagenome]